MLDWDKNFAVIVQGSNPFSLRGHEDIGDDEGEFYERAFGHAVMVLKVDDELHYKGYRFNIGSEAKLRALLHELYTNAQIQHLQDNEIKEKISCIKNILSVGKVQAVIWNEGNSYELRYQQGVSGDIEDDFVYYDLNYEEKEIKTIWTQVKQDESKEKYYSLNPDTAKETGNFPEGALVHNCVTWIVETAEASVNDPLLPRVNDGNISQFTNELRRMGDTRETGKPD